MTNAANIPAQKPGNNEAWAKALEDSAAKFAESKLNFGQEQIFATEQILKNKFLCDIARNNPSSLRLAMYNVAAIGLTLNPASREAYLVPRRKNQNEPFKVCLDVSYIGLIHLGTEGGGINWAKSELVYSNDTWEFRGPAEKPKHVFDPFDTPEQRGVLRGAYCLAELETGGFMVEPMSLADMHKVRDSSEAFKKGVGPWIDWPEQMYLKCPVKRGSKWWPRRTEKLDTALKFLNEENGEGLATLTIPADSSAALPPPAKREEIESKVLNWIDDCLIRASKSGAFASCEEVMEKRLTDKSCLSYALQELAATKERVKSQARRKVA